MAFLVMNNNADSTEELSIREFQELVDPETAENEAWKKVNPFLATPV